MLDDRQRIDRTTEPQSAARNATDQSRLDSCRQLVDYAFFRRHRSNAFRHADTEVDDCFGNQLHRRPATDDLAVV